jgi:hypothetical protein
MMANNLKLHEWISEGRSNGTIQNVATAIWAYCIDEPQALEWIAEIVTGRISEREALGALDVSACVDDALTDLDWSPMLPPSGCGNLTER